MEEKSTEVFLPISYKTYKKSKINLLKTQMKIISSMQRLKKIKTIRKAKDEQRKLLRKSIKELGQYNTKIKRLMPTKKEIEVKGINLEKRPEKQENPQQKPPQRSRIDDELAKIQQKIANLNL